MIAKIMDRLWKESLYSNFNFIKNKLIVQDSTHWKYDLSSVLESKKHLNVNNLIDRLERYSRVIKLNVPESNFNLDFINKNVFELGCGPLLGCGPIFLFLGAKDFYYYEPYLMPETISSKIIRDGYFKRLYDELLRIHSLFFFYLELHFHL